MAAKFGNLSIAFGAFPDVSLAAARDALDEARRQLTNTIDPGILKNSIKRSKKIALKQLLGNGTLNLHLNGAKIVENVF
ncbi:MAG: DUF4102 domain-containing protein [Gammaproteobacteria bacterium]|nr:DUF4102 domain-containing protein [Gammaproteobacteria bacterium]